MKQIQRELASKGRGAAFRGVPGGPQKAAPYSPGGALPDVAMAGISGEGREQGQHLVGRGVGECSTEGEETPPKFHSEGALGL